MLTQNLQDNQYNLFNYWRKKKTFPSTHNLSEKKLEVQSMLKRSLQKKLF